MNVKANGRGKWLIDIRVKKQGKEIRRRETYTGKKVDAEKRYMELRDELKGIATAKCSLTIETFGDALLKYLRYKEYHSNGVGKSKCILDRLERDLQEVKLSEIKAVFREYIFLLKETISETTGKLLTNGTINRHIAFAKAVLNYCVKEDMITDNPLKNVKKLPETPRDRSLSKDEEQKLFKAVREHAPHLEAILQYALYVPCRKSELINMKKEDLCLKTMTIRLRSGTTKNRDACDKPIPPAMYEYFRNLPEESEYLFYRYVKKYKEYRPLGDFKKSWAKCLKSAGIENFRWHDTRAESCSRLADNGTPERIILKVANWRTNMLSNYYRRESKTALELVKFA